jgi:putative ABC transport system permease protein
VVARNFAGDLAIVHQDGFSTIPTQAAGVVAAVPGVQTTSVFKRADSTVAGTGQQTANGIDPQTIGSVYRFDWANGSDAVLGTLGPNGALVEQSLATRAHLRAGSHFTATTPAGKQVELAVRGIYRDQALLEGYTVGLPTFDDVFHQRRAARILVKLLPDADRTRTEDAINRALTAFPEARARSEQQLKDERSARLNSVLYLFYALLTMSIVVSLFGIANTLTLSIHERTRELGMLRAIGMSRRQIRRMIRYESVITAAIGTALGLVLGVFFAGVVVASLTDKGIAFAIPWGQLAVVLGLAVTSGVLAAVVPARRAAGLDVLGAIAYE